MAKHYLAWNVRLAKSETSKSEVFVDLPYDRDFQVSYGRGDDNVDPHPVIVTARIHRAGSSFPIEYVLPFNLLAGIILNACKIEIRCQKIRNIKTQYNLGGRLYYLKAAPVIVPFGGASPAQLK